MARDTAIQRREGRDRQAAETAAVRPLTLYRTFCLFLIAGFAGDLVEMIFWLITRGELTSRSSLLYGPFSLVWGLAAVLLTLVLHRLDGGGGRIFLVGTVLGGVYEYVCAWVQEVLFGACFWDYRHLPLNVHGRINLVFCLFWGFAALMWMRLAYPALCAFIDRVPGQMGRRAAQVAAVLLVCSTVLSAAALYRMDRRHKEVPASGAGARFLDERYPDSRLKARYPNMGILDEIGW